MSSIHSKSYSRMINQNLTFLKFIIPETIKLFKRDRSLPPYFSTYRLVFEVVRFYELFFWEFSNHFQPIFSSLTSTILQHFFRIRQNRNIFLYFKCSTSSTVFKLVFYDIEYEYPCYPPIRSLYQTRVCGHHNYSKHRVITDKINPLNKLMFTKLNSL